MITKTINRPARGYVFHHGPKAQACPFQARIGLDGERVSLGYFPSESQASAAYKAGQKVLAKVSPELARLRARVVDLEAANRILMAGHMRQVPSNSH